MQGLEQLMQWLMDQDEELKKRRQGYSNMPPIELQGGQAPYALQRAMQGGMTGPQRPVEPDLGPSPYMRPQPMPQPSPSMNSVNGQMYPNPRPSFQWPGNVGPRG